MLSIYSDNEFVNDFEAMLAKKKEDSGKRRKRRDIDIINDNDDIIDQLIQDMRAAAEVCNDFVILQLHAKVSSINLKHSKNRMIVN